MFDDLRTAVRSLGQSHGFTIVALLVLALGIGSATAIYSVVDAVVLRSLPFDEYDRLAVLYEKDTKHVDTFGFGNVTPQTYLDWRRLQRPFQALADIDGTEFRLRNDKGEPATARAQRVTHEFFSVLRVAPQLGRAFDSHDEEEGRDGVAILTYGFWRQRFGGSPNAIGRTIALSDRTYEIVGVMPRSFSYPVGSDRPVDLLVPRSFSKEDRTKAGGHNYMETVIGRLEDGVSLRQASDEMWRLSEQLDRESPKWGPGRRAYAVTLQEHLVGKVRGWMLMLLGAVVLVLLIACANVANLMLARATVRAREMSVRAALGASPWRLVRVLLVEGVVLSLTGAALGVLLALGFVNVLRTWMPAQVPRIASISLDARVLAVAVGAALVTGIIFGIVPALLSARPDLTTSLKEGGRSAAAGNAGQRLRNILVVAEVALAVVLLVGAGLFTGSFVQLMRVDPGFDYHNVLALDIGLPWAAGQKFDEEFAARNARYAQDVLDAVRHLPYVVGAAEVDGGLPLTGSWMRTNLDLPGRGELTAEGDDIDLREVTPDYLTTMRIPLRRGRAIEASDRENAPLVMLVNETAARKYWPNQDAVGQRVKIQDKERVVVGIVGDVHHLGPEKPVRQECYVPLAQARSYGVSLVIRTAANPAAALPAVKRAIWRINPEQELGGDDPVTLDGFMDRLIAQRRFNMAVLALFGVLGLVIAAVGIYGVMAYVVAQRTSEIGVRMALGATRGRVVTMVLTRAGALMAAGLLIGGSVAWYFSTTVRAFLFEVQPTDERIFAGALAVLACAGLLASAIPARRAASVDPLIALRQE
jgi:putative ABC transport system permease protein